MTERYSASVWIDKLRVIGDAKLPERRETLRGFVRESPVLEPPPGLSPGRRAPPGLGLDGPARIRGDGTQANPEAATPGRHHAPHQFLSAVGWD